MSWETGSERIRDLVDAGELGQVPPDSELALPFTQVAPIPAHGLLRKLAPLMLLVYLRRDAREMF